MIRDEREDQADGQAEQIDQTPYASLVGAGQVNRSILNKPEQTHAPEHQHRAP
jgi:hypothetical protein